MKLNDTKKCSKIFAVAECACKYNFTFVRHPEAVS
jgi:hypothetical protein